MKSVSERYSINKTYNLSKYLMAQKYASTKYELLV